VNRGVLGALNEANPLDDLLTPISYDNLYFVLFPPVRSNTMVANIEYRYDRFTGSGGGFYKGSDNILVPDQHPLIFAKTWHFGMQ
jgi:hypothetical protein